MVSRLFWRRHWIPWSRSPAGPAPRTPPSPLAFPFLPAQGRSLSPSWLHPGQVARPHGPFRQELSRRTRPDRLVGSIAVLLSTDSLLCPCNLIILGSVGSPENTFTFALNGAFWSTANSCNIKHLSFLLLEDSIDNLFLTPYIAFLEVISCLISRLQGCFKFTWRWAHHATLSTLLTHSPLDNAPGFTCCFRFQYVCGSSPFESKILCLQVTSLFLGCCFLGLLQDILVYASS